MQRYIVMRVGQSIIALIILSMIIFALGRFTGDPIILLLPQEATIETELALRAHYGLDQPWPIQYWKFISNAVQFDFGDSIKSKRPVMDLIGPKVMNSLRLGLAGMVITLIIGIPLGVLAAVKRDTFFDGGAKLIAILGQSLPQFWVGIMLIQLFTVQLDLLPAAGTGGISHYAMPAFTLGWWVAAAVMRLLRSSMLDALDGGIHQNGPDQGLAGIQDCLEAHLQECPDSGADFCRHLPGDFHHRRHPGGDGVCVARPGTPGL